MNKMQLRFEFWETQALGYWILSYLVEPTHPTISTCLFWYGCFTFAGALCALFCDKKKH